MGWLNIYPCIQCIIRAHQTRLFRPHINGSQYLFISNYTFSSFLTNKELPFSWNFIPSLLIAPFLRLLSSMFVLRCGSGERSIKIYASFSSLSQLRDKSCCPVFAKCGEPWCLWPVWYVSILPRPWPDLYHTTIYDQVSKWLREWWRLFQILVLQFSH